MNSWIEGANSRETHFPIQNLPFGAAKMPDGSMACVSAIGSFVVNLTALEAAKLLDAGSDGAVFDQDNLNKFMARGSNAWRSVRNQLADLLKLGGKPDLHSSSKLQAKVLFPQSAVEMKLPFTVAEYTDFYAGKQHAKNVGTMFRGASDLPANWLHIPIGYNGRASTVVVSGTDIRRPNGQLKPPGSDAPVFGPSKKMDIELELGAVVGTGNKMGTPITTAEADEMIFGYVLMNDWSSRDIQAWEYQPLGPFQGKAFGTSIGAWVVTKDALEPFRTQLPARDLPNLPYLEEAGPGLYDINLKVDMTPKNAAEPTTICQTNYSRMYYSLAQQLTHHAIGGCQMNTGDLLGSGTISGTEPSEFGSLLELSWNGEREIECTGGETRTFIEDHDRLTMTGWAQGEDYRIGFGECTGCILPAIKM
ncbi:MAG: fumarylacetoacetase [Candidatus Azotimanducaceae bacterium]|jgi:fumarylacetoacetase